MKHANIFDGGKDSEGWERNGITWEYFSSHNSEAFYMSASDSMTQKTQQNGYLNFVY